MLISEPQEPLRPERREFGSSWEAITWNGEAAWQSGWNGWIAVVSESRARLIALYPPGSRQNAFYCPERIPTDRSLPQGGHVLWLGPQRTWNWPPPVEWQDLDGVVVSNETLSLIHPSGDFPSLRRSYRWDAHGLICSAEWTGSMPVHAVHIFQMPPSSLVSVKGPLRRESVKVFDGYSLTDFDERIGVEFSRSGLSIRFIEQSSKFGLPPETLLATHESAALELHPCADLSGPLPDQGFVTQVWTGDVTLPFVEIEQLSAIRRESVGEAAAIRLCPRTRA